MIVPDASALGRAFVGVGTASRVALDLITADDDRHAPHLVDLEVVSMIRRLLRTGQITGEEADSALGDLVGLGLTRYPHLGLVPRIWELRATVTPYDASYVALAEVLGATLVTADSRLARAPGPRCAVQLLD